ncbi:hypothetical protein [Pseudolactococcus piscium]|uniref:Uncharacterized protein n=1 Tax=Pseudolactococcus piscium MKFS47 TaxID=297352 RepID=A0A0D6DVP1_9LACT|nr:hypothetical protein [Lactococcus piscium]CEN27806.1 Uncharacterized protein LACPI_0606 [Lactococcus piscium MKFS47]
MKKENSTHNTTQLKDELIEQMLESKWLDIYANKLNRKFSKYSTVNSNPSKDSLISNLWESLLIYERNNNINASYQSIERYCFQKAYTLTSEEFLSDLGKYRRGKQKNWEQVKVAYVDEIHAREHYFDDYPGLEGEYVYDDTQLTSTKNKAFAIDVCEDNLTRSQATFIKSVLGLGVESTKHNLELNAKSFNNRLNRTIKAIQNKSNKYEIVSERETKINSKLDIINQVVDILEDENSNEIRIYKAFVIMYESSISYLYSKAFNSVDKEIALQLFKENNGKKYAYQLVNVVYAEKEKLEMKLVA